MKNDISNSEDVKKLVEVFYSKVETDEIIGHFFSQVAKVNWSHHKKKLTDFWTFTLLGEGSYQGPMVQAHQQIHQIEALNNAHFNHWVYLFTKTIDELFEGEIAERAKQRGYSISLILQLKLGVVF